MMPANNIESMLKWCLIPEKITNQNKYEMHPYLNIALKKTLEKDKDITFLTLLVNILKKLYPKNPYITIQSIQ